MASTPQEVKPDEVCKPTGVVTIEYFHGDDAFSDDRILLREVPLFCGGSSTQTGTAYEEVHEVSRQRTKRTTIHEAASNPNIVCDGDVSEELMPKEALYRYTVYYGDVCPEDCCALTKSGEYFKYLDVEKTEVKETFEACPSGSEGAVITTITNTFVRKQRRHYERWVSTGNCGPAESEACEQMSFDEPTNAALSWELVKTETDIYWGCPGKPPFSVGDLSTSLPGSPICANLVPIQASTSLLSL